MIDTDGSGAAAGDAAFLEGAWAGHVVEMGEAELEITKSTERCVMTTRAQSDLPLDRSVLRMLHDVNTSNFGVYATATTPGAVTIGNPVRIRPVSR